MRFTNGWVKVHRKLLNNEWSQCLDVIGKGVLIELLLMANIQDSRYVDRGQVKILRRGEILIGIRKLAESMGIDRGTLLRRLEILKNMGTIKIETSHSGTHLTICNYDKYQSNEKHCEPPTIHEDYHEDYHQRSTDAPPIEELKNSKKVKNLKKSIPPAPLDPSWMSLGQDWLKLGLSVMPWQAKQPKWNADAFGRELERIGGVMGIDHTGMRVILEKLNRDDFWRRNAASPFGLMSRSKNGNRKIDNLISSFKSKTDFAKEALSKFEAEASASDPSAIPF